MENKPIISKEQLEKELKDWYYGKEKVDPSILDNKILSGYWYMISRSNPNEPYKTKTDPDRREVRASTGKAGIETFIKSCREGGIPDSMIGESIWLKIEDGNDGKWVTINQLTVNAKETEDQEPEKEDI